MVDVYIKVQELKDVENALESIVFEFDHAESRSDALQSAIGYPFGNGQLANKAQDFEERWSDKRKDLKEGLEDVKKHVKDVIDGFQKWDSQTAMHFESKK